MTRAGRTGIAVAAVAAVAACHKTEAQPAPASGAAAAPAQAAPDRDASPVTGTVSQASEHDGGAPPPSRARGGAAVVRQVAAQQGRSDASPGGGPRARAHCPMVGEDVRVDVEDTASGVALSFTTREGDADALRRRVRHMARMYQMHHGERRMMWQRMDGPMGRDDMGRGMGMGRDDMGRGMGMGRGDMGPGPGRDMPRVQTRVDTVDRGARLVLTPADPGDLDTLRERVRRHQQRMAGGQCWMLEDRDRDREGG